MIGQNREPERSFQNPLFMSTCALRVSYLLISDVIRSKVWKYKIDKTFLRGQDHIPDLNCQNRFLSKASTP